MKTVTLTDAQTGASAQVLIDLGFNCYRWSVPVRGGFHEVLYSEPGFSSGEKRPSGSGIPLLFPFPGRIAEGKYRYGGREYRLPTGDGRGNAIHGFVYDRPWRVIEQEPARVMAEFHAARDDPALLDLWPGDFRIRVSYSVQGSELVCDAQYDNPGERPLPCGFGTHPYFRMPLGASSTPGDVLLQVPVTQQWELEQMLPTGRLLRVPAGAPLRGDRPLGDYQFDLVYRLASPGVDGRIHMELADGASRRAIRQSVDGSFRQVVVYTPDHRQAVCLEPLTCTPDPFRMEESGVESGLTLLEPGQSALGRVRLEWLAEPQ